MDEIAANANGRRRKTAPWPRRLAVGIAVAVVVVTGTPTSVLADENAGACVFDVSLSSSNSVLVPGNLTWSLSANGSCADAHTTVDAPTGGPVNGTLGGTLTSVAVPTTTPTTGSCAVGVLDGALTFTSPSTDPKASTTIRAVHVGAVLVVVMAAGLSFVGAGVFVLSPMQAVPTAEGALACATYSASVTWRFVGPFAFGDRAA